MGMSVETKPVYLAPNEGYLEDSYCDPVARGRGLHSQMNNYRVKKIFEEGKDRVIAIVQDGNTPALKVQNKSGFEELGTFRHGFLFGIKFNTLNKRKFDNR
jgi:L-amino acid N-acyltransferase YncA